MASGPRRRAMGRLPAMLALAVGCAASGAEAPTVEGSVSGQEADHAVWLGVFGDDPAAAEWFEIEGGVFEVPLPAGERATLLAVSRDRAPLAVPVSRSSERRVELRLSPGLELAGTVQSEDGGALPGATIRIAAADDGFEVPPFAAPSWRSGRGGAFRAGGLRPGPHTVEASAEGHMPLVLDDVQIRDDGANRVELELIPAAFVEGRVVDADGAPAAGVEVETAYSGLTARTRDDGSFRIGPFKTGLTSYLRVRSPELGSTPFHVVVAPHRGLALRLGRHVLRGRVVDATSGGPVERFRVTVFLAGRGEVVDNIKRRKRPDSTLVEAADGSFEIPVDAVAHFIVVDAPGRFPWSAPLVLGSGGEYDLGELVLEPDRSIAGRVVDRLSGAPVADAWVSFSPPAGGPHAFVPDVRSASTKTDEDGAFLLGGLPAGAARIAVSARGYPGKYVEVRQDVDYLDVEIGAGATIAGSFALPDGTPVAGSIFVHYITRGSAWGEPVADGTFRWDGLGDGEYRLRPRSKAGRMASRTVEIRDGESVEGIRFTVDPGGTLSGAVAGLRSGEAATITVASEDGRTVRRSSFGNGAYVLRGVPKDAATAAATSFGRTLARRVRLDERGEASADWDFSARGRLAGTVTAGGRPLAGLVLTVLPADPSLPRVRTGTSDLGGYEALGLSEGPHFVRTLAGHTLQVYVGRDTAFDIELPANSLSGTVRRERTGEPLGGGAVRLRRVGAPVGSGHGPVNAKVTSDGSFRFAGLPEGEYAVRVTQRNFETASRRVRVVGAERVDILLSEARQP